MAVNLRELVSISQLVDLLRARMVWGYGQKVSLICPNRKGVYEQLEHSHQLQAIWEKYSTSREVDMLAVVDDVGASFTDAASLVYDKDADKTAYHLTMQVDPYMAILAGGDERLQPLVDVKMMVDPLDITVEHIKEHLAANIMLGPNQKTRLMW